MKFGALILLAALSLRAQTTFEIRGTVTEPELGGIAGAEVRVTPQVGIGTQVPVLTTFTDGRGVYVLRVATPGTYSVRASRTGYGSVSAETGYVVLSTDRPTAEVAIRLVRLGQLSGRVVDADTREPLEGIEVLVIAKRSIQENRARSWQPSTPSGDAPQQRLEAFLKLREELKTKPGGTFTRDNLPPGEYVATLALDRATPWSLGFSADDLKAFDERYPAVFWPGGVSEDAVRPVTLGAGSVASFGDILAKTTRHYRAHVSIAQGTCPSGESMRLMLYRRDSLSAPAIVAPCGSELLLRGLEPGSYFIYAVSDWQAFRDHIEDAAWATAQFEIADKNTEVMVIPHPGVVVEGRFIAAEGVDQLPDEVTLSSSPDPLVPGTTIPGEEFFERLPDGTFRMAVFPGPVALDVGVRLPHYPAQLRYNGSPTAGAKLPVNPGSAVQRLDVVFDTRVGSVTGSVAGGGPPQVIVLWHEYQSHEPMVARVANGSYRAEQLVPGEYRAVKIQQSELGGVLLGNQIAGDQRVTVRVGETAILNFR